MKARIVLAALTLATAGAMFAPAAQAAPTAPFDPDLGREAHWVIDTSKYEESTRRTTLVYARCYATEAAFDGAVRWRFGNDPRGLWAYAIEKEHTIYLRPSTCRAANRFMWKMLMGVGETSKATETEVGAYSTLLHEALHVQGIKDERTTECIANNMIRWSAVTKYVPQSEANRLSRIAFNVSRKMTSRKYHSVSGECQNMLSGRDWTEFVE